MLDNLPKWIKNGVVAILLLVLGAFGWNAIAPDSEVPDETAGIVLSQAAALADFQVQLDDALDEVGQLSEAYEEAAGHVRDLTEENLALRELVDAALGDVDPDADKGGVEIDGTEFGEDATTVEPIIADGMKFIIVTKCPYTPTAYSDDENKKGRPIMEMEVPADERVRYECGEAVLVQSEKVKADGGDLYYLIEGPRGIGRYIQVRFTEPVPAPVVE